MLIGVPKEIKTHEYRVGLVPASVRELIARGHKVIVETNAGMGIGFADQDYLAVGAEIADTPEEIFSAADMIVKVKEPQRQECKLLREGQVLFTYLHLAPDPELAQLLQESGCIAIAYETVTAKEGGLPLLAPMSEVAGRLSIQVGARCLEKPQKGSGILLGGVAGVAPAKVVVIGGGVVGYSAIRTAVGAEAHVTVLDRSISRLNYLDTLFGSRLNTIYSTTEALEEYVTTADLVIGAVLVPGASAPKLVTRDFLKKMRPGSVLVDVAIDQGGCFETSKATTHADPTYVVDDIIHYCVANMPGAVPKTASFALNNVTLPFVMQLAKDGVQLALSKDEHLRNGLNIYYGKITHQAVAESLKQPYYHVDEVI